MADHQILHFDGEVTMNPMISVDFFQAAEGDDGTAMAALLAHAKEEARFSSLLCNYHLVIQHSHGKSPFLIGEPSINGPFSMAMLNNQRVYVMLSCLSLYRS